MSVAQVVEITFPPSTVNNTVLGIAVVHARPKVGVMVAPRVLDTADVTLGTWTITVQATNNPRAQRFDMQGRPINPQETDDRWYTVGTIAQADLNTIKYFDGPFWAIRLKLTAISGYTAGDLVAWVV